MIYSFDRTTRALNRTFGTSGRREITGPEERHMLRSITPAGERLLVVMDESIDNREFSKTCNDMMEVLRKGLEQLSSQLNQPLLTSDHVEFEANLSLQAKLTDEHQVFDVR